MSLGSSLATPAPLEPPDASNPYGWDWSDTTHELGADTRNEKAAFLGEGVVLADTVADLLRRLGAVVTLPGKGLQGWARSVEAYDAGGYKTGAVYFGGGRDDVHVRSTSAAADEARVTVATAGRVKTARVDTRVDSLVPFDELAAILCDASDAYGSQIVYVESGWRPGEHQTGGRTVYLGAPSSAIRVRLYEKWLESPGQYVEGTNRLEVQLRPPSRAKERVSGWSRAQTFCASRVTQHLASRLGTDLVPRASLHVARDTPDLERTLEVMGQQYGRAVDRWLAVSGGDIDTVVQHLVARRSADGEEPTPGR